MRKTVEINSFAMGIRDGLPICFGYFSVSFAFGIFAVGLGLSVWEATLISMLNLTSAGQFAGTPIIAGGGSFFELGLTQLVINLRYSLMSVSLSQRLGKSVKFKDRFLISFANTDEIFAVSVSKNCMVGKTYFHGLMITPYLGWSLGTLLGAVLGSVLPAFIISALGVAIYAMFVAILVPPAKSDLKVAFAIIFAIALSCVFYYIPTLSKIPSGFVIIIVAVAVSLAFAALFPVSDGEVADNE